MTVRFVVVVLLVGIATANSVAQSLRGSKASVAKQFEQVREHDFTRLPNSEELHRFISLGLLVRLASNGNYTVDEYVSHPFIRPATKLFVERVSGQYRAACGEKIVVTSGTRPLDEQPRNASRYSAHPAGMSVDFRISDSASCRKWLEQTLLTLEKRKVLEATRETTPPHYHITVFSSQYQRYVAEKTKPRTKSAPRKRR